MTCETCLTYIPDDAPDWWFVTEIVEGEPRSYVECPECGEDDDA
jgi:hypothetical protein